MTEGSALRVSYDLIFGRERPWRISVPADSLADADNAIREHYGHPANPSLRFRRVAAEDRDGKRVAGRGEWVK